MALDVFKALNFNPEWANLEDEDKLNEEFSKHYIHRDMVGKDQNLVNAITGRRMGAFETKLSGYVPDGVDLDLKDKKAEEKAEAIINHYKSQFETTKATLDEMKKGGIDDKKYADLMEKYNHEKTRATTFEQQATQFQTERDTVKNEYEGKLKGIQVSGRLEKLMAKIQFADGLPELARKGFENEVHSSYKFNLNDKEELEVLDAKTGEPIARDKNAGFMTAEEAITGLAAKHKILKLHNGGKQEPKKPFEQPKKEYNRVLPNASIRNKMGGQ